MKIEVGKAYKCRYGLIWFCEAIVAKLHTFKEHAVMYQSFDTDTGTPADAVLYALDEISKLCEKRG